jgi:hypothetical protein
VAAAAVTGRHPHRAHAVRFGEQWLIAVPDGDRLLQLGAQLNALPSLPVATPTEPLYAITAQPDHNTVAVAHRAGLRAYACQPARGEAHLLWEVRHDPWEEFASPACAFDGPARLWWVRTGPYPAVDRLAVLDPRTGDALAEADLAPAGYIYQLVIHPGGSAALVEGAAGQDPTILWRAELGPNGLAVEQLTTGDRIMGGFSPDGARFVTVPHAWGDPLLVHRWPDAAVLEALATSSVFLDEREVSSGEPENFEYQALFADERHVLVDTRQRRLLLLRTGPLELIAELWPEGYELVAYGAGGQPVDDLEDVVDYAGDLTTWTIAGERLLTLHRTGHLCLWDLAAAAQTEIP